MARFSKKIPDEISVIACIRILGIPEISVLMVNLVVTTVKIFTQVIYTCMFSLQYLLMIPWEIDWKRKNKE